MKSICQACRDANLRTGFEGPLILPPGKARLRVKWGVRTLLREQHCPMCRFLQQIIHSLELDTDISVYETIRGEFLDLKTCPEQRRLELELVPADRRFDLSSFILPYFILPVANGSPMDQKLPQQRAREVASGFLDIDLIRRWLSMCSVSHSFCKEVPDSHFSGLSVFRLIDVSKLCIVQGVTGVKYVALSYVWGRKTQHGLNRLNEEVLSTPGALPLESSSLPATIRESILLCRALDVRYLWVDSLCILQDSVDDKQAQIPLMNHIYGQAYLTIVAAAGSDSDAGLPGVPGGRSRDARLLASSVQGLNLAAVDHSLLRAIRNSTWNSRGWTFQEAVLSRRILIFTGSIVAFTCATAFWREDICYDQDEADPEWQYREQVVLARPFNFHFDPSMPKKVYQRSLQSYLIRNWTREDDVLNAFAGISSFLQPLVGPSYWGVPEKIFAPALLWHSRVEARRELFPSWSWSGWVHSAQLEFVGTPHGQLIHLITVSRFDEASSRPTLVYTPTDNEDAIIPRSLLEECSQYCPIPLHPLSRLLVVRAQSIEVTVGSCISEIRLSEEETTFPEEQHDEFELSHPHFGGYVSMTDEEGLSPPVPPSPRFLPTARLLDESARSHTTEPLHAVAVAFRRNEFGEIFGVIALLVAWSAGIASRTGVCDFIDYRDWTVAEPDLKDFVLG